MKAIMVMYDSLIRRYLAPYNPDTPAITPNFGRLAAHTVRFDSCYAGSLPCMPARRELLTGRTNFLHRSWGPIEPYDVCMPQLLSAAGIHTHLVSDHTHYWEDGGATYHTRYSTWENIRGQEGDPWKAILGEVPDERPNLIPFTGMREKLYKQDLINRSYMQAEEDHAQVKTFSAGLEFLERNADADNWFLQIEAFDPHEPFFSYEKYRKLYPESGCDNRFDWPDYAPVNQTEEEILEACYSYCALLSMCDAQLGRVLDFMDAHDLWKDTMLIVNTDHGYCLGDHGFWTKNYMPPYEEVVHTPLFIWDPRFGQKNVCRKSLIQTIDLPATLLEFFGQPIPEVFTGRCAAPILRDDTPIHEGALFGVHGAQVCCTDGRYVYMKAPASSDNQPLYDYTLMPTHMTGFFSEQELSGAALAPPFSFTRNMPLLKVAKGPGISRFLTEDLLFDLETDPYQNHPIEDAAVKECMEALLISLMQREDAPREQYQRLSLLPRIR